MAKGESSSLDFLAGFIVGGAIGAIVGILMAPQSGEQTRAQLAERSIELRDELQRHAGKVQESVPTFVEEQRGRVQEAIEKGKEAAAKKRQEILAQLEAQKRTDAQG